MEYNTYTTQVFRRRDDHGFRTCRQDGPCPGLGVVGLAKTLSAEFAPYGILVNAIGPGRFDTERIRQLDRALAERKGLPVEDVSRASLSRIPPWRYGDPAEYGRLAVFLGSGANTYITGRTILADGGMVKAVP